MRLFFYGVLMDHVARGGVRDLLSGIGPGVPATAMGTLYAVPDPHGWFPALMPDGDGGGASLVHGMLHDAAAVDLAGLDRFEGCDPGDPLRGDYRRIPLNIDLANGGSAMAFAYVWNRPVTAEMVLIPGGDFSRWLAESGNQSFQIG